MLSRLEQRRGRVQAEYGFEFPDDFYRFWEFVSRLAPLDPLHALTDTLDLTLVGPFEVLAGRFDGRVPRHSLLLHWRYHDDPPEFFTVLASGSQGFHYGYFLDDPGRLPGCVASYDPGDAHELSTDGDTLFEALRLHLEYAHGDFEAYRDGDPDHRREYQAGLAEIAELRSRLLVHATADRPEFGDAYTERYGGTASRQQRRLAATLEGMGIVADEGLYRPLSLPDRDLWRQLRRGVGLAEVVEEARQAAAEGYPATALKLGKDLWATGRKRATAHALDLLDAAYEALGRESLRRVLQTHRANRTLASVDILEAESDA